MVARSKIYVSIFYGATVPSGPWLPQCQGFTITRRHTAVGRTPLDEWSSRHRDLYLTTHNTHNRQTDMTSAGFEPEIPASEQSQPTPQAARTLGSASVPINLSEIEIMVIQFVASRWHLTNISLAGHITSESILCHRWTQALTSAIMATAF